MPSGPLIPILVAAVVWLVAAAALYLLLIR
jgi:hypothetical protein